MSRHVWFSSSEERLHLNPCGNNEFVLLYLCFTLVHVSDPNRTTSSKITVPESTVKFDQSLSSVEQINCVVPHSLIDWKYSAHCEEREHAPESDYTSVRSL